MVLFTRSLSRVTENEEVSVTELTGNPSASNTESLFGIAPRKLRNVEDEDFVPASPVPFSRAPLQQNYFSQAWAAQKQRPLDWRPDRMEEQLPHPGPSLDVPAQQPSPLQNWAQSRVWLRAPDLQVSTQETFTFVSFKVLASANAFKHRGKLYAHVPSQILDWKSRRRKILSELELCSPDIICLQEVDRFSDLQSDLALKGYVGLYKVRPGVAPDGCALFWRQKRFKLLHEESLEFNFMGTEDHVAQFCVLQSIVPGASKMGDTSKSGIPGQCQSRCLIVGNINVLFNPKRGDIKLGQCRVFLEQAHKLSNSWPEAPLVLGGCFNCTPQSSMYEFLAKSELDVSGLDRRYLSGQLPEAGSSASKRGTEAKKSEDSSAKVSLAMPKKEELDVDLSDRLKASLTARFASKQEIYAMEFASSAREVLKMYSGTSSSRTSNPVNKLESKAKDPVVKNFISKTIEILESSLSSQGSLKEMAEGGNLANDGVNGVDISPGIGRVVSSEATCTKSSFLSVGQRYTKAQASDHTQISSSESVYVSDPSGGGMEVPTESSAACDQFSCGNDAKKESIPDAVEGGVEVPTKSSVACDRLLHVNTAQEGSIPDAVDERGMDTAVPHCTPPDVSVQSTMPDHCWDLEELKTATGRPDSTVIKHKLNLCSVYPEVQGQMHTRDAKGEPLLTMYHRQFRGTVDYIWRSDGLKTVKVLDTVPLKAMLVTPGLPSMVWGSDHVALACEFAFSTS